MIIGSVCENKASEKRISVTPDNVKKFVSNGFKMRSSGAGNNASGTKYLYMAFAEEPFVASNGNPATS